MLELAVCSPRDDRWDGLKPQVDRVAGLLVDHSPRHTERLTNCSNYLGFSVDGDGEHKLTEAKFCRVRLCPICTWRKQMVWRARLFNAVPKLIADHPTAKFIFLTLTVSNVPVNQLSASVIRLNKAWHRMTNRKTWPAVGYLRALEITKQKHLDYVHPHIHALLMVKPQYYSRGYMKTNQWANMWRQSLKVDYDPIVDVRAIKPKKGKDLTESVLSALCYHVKGITTDDRIYADQEWFCELFDQTNRIRTVSLGGIIRDYLREDDPEDLITLESEEETHQEENDQNVLFYGWNSSVKKYIIAR